MSSHRLTRKPANVQCTARFWEKSKKKRKEKERKKDKGNRNMHVIGSAQSQDNIKLTKLKRERTAKGIL